MIMKKNLSIKILSFLVVMVSLYSCQSEVHYVNVESILIDGSKDTMSIPTRFGYRSLYLDNGCIHSSTRNGAFICGVSKFRELE